MFYTNIKPNKTTEKKVRYCLTFKFRHVFVNWDNKTKIYWPLCIINPKYMSISVLKVKSPQRRSPVSPTKIQYEKLYDNS